MEVKRPKPRMVFGPLRIEQGARMLPDEVAVAREKPRVLGPRERAREGAREGERKEELTDKFFAHSSVQTRCLFPPSLPPFPPTTCRRVK